MCVFTFQLSNVPLPPPGHAIGHRDVLVPTLVNACKPGKRDITYFIHSVIHQMIHRPYTGKLDTGVWPTYLEFTIFWFDSPAGIVAAAAYTEPVIRTPAIGREEGGEEGDEEGDKEGEGE